MMSYPAHIDLHMHSTVSDGTDTPEEILDKVRQKGISLFALSDHDAFKGCLEIRALLKPGDPMFINGVEFSCKDEEGKYHILGYGYDAGHEAVREVTESGHANRINKLKTRLEYLKDTYGFTFSDEDVEKLYALDNPGKPHIGNMMVKYGYAKNKSEAIDKYIDGAQTANRYLRPEEAIGAIIKAGGIPVLAHPFYGSGDQLIVGEDMEYRLKKLIGFGLKGVEAFYSGFTSRLIRQMLSYADQFDLYITAGSDYHGNNKMIVLGDNNLPSDPSSYPEGLKRFMNDVNIIIA